MTPDQNPSDRTPATIMVKGTQKLIVVDSTLFLRLLRENIQHHSELNHDVSLWEEMLNNVIQDINAIVLR